MVDVGAYTERGEWVDAFLHMGQIKDDGGYIAHVGHLALFHNVPAISFHMFQLGHPQIIQHRRILGLNPMVLPIFMGNTQLIPVDTSCSVEPGFFS